MSLDNVACHVICDVSIAPTVLSSSVSVQIGFGRPVWTLASGLACWARLLGLAFGLVLPADQQTFGLV
ncbi:hypothetical protein LIER_32401 [Lithospermum erythrorhizon]|uniref:Uncharacterized protein n=1 Tax=Lithospermum erythrorhizon TaxID=34254 RepID=A0AAV3RTR2_LITER